jgi:hypothetical protein
MTTSMNMTHGAISSLKYFSEYLPLRLDNVACIIYIYVTLPQHQRVFALLALVNSQIMRRTAKKKGWKSCIRSAGHMLPTLDINYNLLRN